MKLSASTIAVDLNSQSKNDDASFLHQSITEQGKLYFLDGEFIEALKYFRYALELAVQTESPDFLIKQYMRCLLEALEMTENYSAVVAYCDRVISLLEIETTSLENLVDLAQAYQKKGVLFLKLGDQKKGKSFLEEALRLAKANKFPLPLVDNLMFLLNSGILPSKERLFEEQQQTGYFFINQENINEAVAMKMEEV